MDRLNRRLHPAWLVATMVALFFGVGCGGTASDTKISTEILGNTKLVALQSIAGEPSLKQLVLVQADGSKLKTQPIDKAYAFLVSPDYQTIAYVGDDGLYLAKTNSKGKIKISDLSPKFDLNTDQERLVGQVMAWSPDGKSLAFACGGDLFLVEIGSGQGAKIVTKRSPEQITTSSGAAAVAPRIEGIVCPNWLDDQIIIYHDYYNIFNGLWQSRFNIMRVERDGTNRQVLIKDGQEPILSPDKTMILYHVNDDRGGQIKLALVDGSNQRTLIGLRDKNQDPMIYAWSKDGTYVLFDGLAINVKSGHQIVFSGEPDLQTKGSTSHELPSLSPNGRWIIYSTSQGLRVVKTENGGFAYDESGAFSELEDLHSISWIK